MSLKECAVCSKSCLPGSHGTQCAACKLWFHNACAGIVPSAGARPLKWFCKPCGDKLSQQSPETSPNVSTLQGSPAPASASASSTPRTQQSDSLPQDREGLKNHIHNITAQMKHQTDTYLKKLAEFKAEQEGFVAYRAELLKANIHNLNRISELGKANEEAIAAAAAANEKVDQLEAELKSATETIADIQRSLGGLSPMEIKALRDSSLAHEAELQKHRDEVAKNAADLVALRAALEQNAAPDNPFALSQSLFRPTLEEKDNQIATLSAEVERLRAIPQPREPENASKRPRTNEASPTNSGVINDCSMDSPPASPSRPAVDVDFLDNPGTLTITPIFEERGNQDLITISDFNTFSTANFQTLVQLFSDMKKSVDANMKIVDTNMKELNANITKVNARCAAIETGKRPVVSFQTPSTSAAATSNTPVSNANPTASTFADALRAAKSQNNQVLPQPRRRPSVARQPQQPNVAKQQNTSQQRRSSQPRQPQQQRNNRKRSTSRFTNGFRPSSQARANQPNNNNANQWQTAGRRRQTRGSNANERQQPSLPLSTIMQRSSRNINTIRHVRATAVSDEEAAKIIQQISMDQAIEAIGYDSVNRRSERHVTISMATEEQASKLDTLIEQNYAGLASSTAPAPLKNMIQVTRTVPVEDDNPEAIVSSFLRANKWLAPESTEYVRHWDVQAKNGTHRNIILALSPLNQTEALNRGHLLFRLNSHVAHEYIETLQCKNCWNFGHLATACRLPQACRNCGLAHNTESCTTKKERCANCIRFNERKSTKPNNRRNTNHRVTDRRCPVFRGRLEGLKTLWASI